MSPAVVARIRPETGGARSGDQEMSRRQAGDLELQVGAGEGNRTLMTCLEGVLRRAVVATDLHVGVAGGSRG
jgi:hypothetical protein